MTMLGVTILGSTGSIGVSTLDVLARHPDRYRIEALTAHSQTDRLFDQCCRFRPRLAVLSVETEAELLRRRLQAVGVATEVHSGAQAIEMAAGDAGSSIVMAAIVGAAGLMPVLAAVRAGKRVLIANKEPLVMSGHLLLQEAQRHNATLLPIDSEHNAIFQCLPTGFRAGVTPPGIRKILLTCSGGPFRHASLNELQRATPEQAIAHPRWAMGRKISVDSATLMNKGLELIEACVLFGVTADQVQIVIHPQSIVHSLVEYSDGSVLAQMGNPDMRTPIAHALAWPERIASGVPALDLFAVARLDFEAPDPERFPCLRLAGQAIQQGGTAPAILNAANEVAVSAFLEKRIGFTQIADTIAHALNSLPATDDSTLEDVLAADVHARDLAERYIAGLVPMPRSQAL